MIHPRAFGTLSGDDAMKAERATAGAHQRFNPYVHGARGLFSVMVFAFHIANSGWTGFAVPGANAVHFAVIGFQYGVELFFGISGFVIIGALERSSSLPLYFWDRFTRIYPVLWATIAVIIVLMILMHQPLPTVPIIALNAVVPPPFVPIVPLNPPAWSLSWELSFYALCAIGFAFRRSRAAVCTAVAVGLITMVIFPRTLLMLPGLLIATGRMKFVPVRMLSRYPATCLVGFLLTWHGLGMLAGGGPNRISPVLMPVTEWLAYMPGIVLAAMLGTAALAGIIDGIGWLGRLLAGRLMRWLGTISYSFYLWHPIALHGTKVALTEVAPGLNVSPFGQSTLALCGFPVALLLAFLSQALIETHLTRWLRRLVGETRRAATVTTADPEIAAALQGSRLAGANKKIIAGETP